jgi:carbonic anhydrase
VDPSLIFGAEPGDMFVLRNVANLVPPYAPDEQLHGTSAAIEFAVRTLQVEHVIVMGHTRCGGVHALMQDVGESGSDFVSGWMTIARAARDRALVRSLSAGLNEEQTLRICEQEVVAASMGNLMSFPWIREAAQNGRLQIHGLWFDVETGQLFRLNPASNVYEAVT